jgi:hypothetical protein
MTQKSYLKGHFVKCGGESEKKDLPPDPLGPIRPNSEGPLTKRRIQWGTTPGTDPRLSASDGIGGEMDVGQTRTPAQPMTRANAPERVNKGAKSS